MRLKPHSAGRLNVYMVSRREPVGSHILDQYREDWEAAVLCQTVGSTHASIPLKSDPDAQRRSVADQPSLIELRTHGYIDVASSMS